MKLTNFIKTAATTLAVAIVGFLPASAAAIPAGSIPYDGANTQGTSFPAFNVFNGVPSVGNEADFIRLKKDGEANSTYRNSVDATCKTGDRFNVWFYVHNGANPAGNADGSAIARNVVAKLGLPSANASSFSISGGVTAVNAEAVNDGATLNCGSGTFKIKYVADSASAFLEQTSTNVAVPNSIATASGAPIGSVAGSFVLGQNNVLGCWGERVWMSMKVEVEEVQIPKVIPATCDLLDVTKTSKSITIKNVKYTANDATVNGVTVSFGDGTTKVLTIAELPFTHNYASEGNYSIKATLNTSLGDVTSTACTAAITKTPVVTPPTKIPDTGAGSTIAIFAVVTAAGAFVHNLLARRKVRG